MSEIGMIAEKIEQWALDDLVPTRAMRKIIPRAGCSDRRFDAGIRLHDPRAVVAAAVDPAPYSHDFNPIEKAFSRLKTIDSR